MRCLFLFILLSNSFARLQCQGSKSFFVTRRNTKKAICIGPRWNYDIFPTFDLDKLKIPPDVGFKYWDWLSEWQLQNYTNVRQTDSENKVWIAGNQPFHFVGQSYLRRRNVYILAFNISLWMAEENAPRGAGMLFELDHLNKTTKLKDTTLKYCDQNPEVEGANCTIVEYKNGTNQLNYGNRWTRFWIQLNRNRTGVEISEYIYGKYKPVVAWTWNNTNIFNPFPSYYFTIFAKSHQRNAALWTRGGNADPDFKNNKEMKRKYTKRSSGKLCVCVEWNEDASDDLKEMLGVKNLVSRGVQPPTNTTQAITNTFYEWNNLEAGEYEFTLRFDKRQPRNVDLCREEESKIMRTWTSMPKAITKCQFNVGEAFEVSAWPSSTPDPTIKPDWTLEDWEHVCDQLGIASNDTEAQIKFCDFYGCNFSKCRHLQHEPPSISLLIILMCSGSETQTK